ncbi:MAG: homoserine dehydrogenase [Helicobacter sp.]|uniref:homoserine dehydrogenase n=1 Tax=Helicobacter sp. 10-6591 TaxID=2004998 RepID=UPI000DCE5BEB|nr:homoserine dehydrogenase [Helicobacter sp. 10-6591]MCI6217646.1 homoserine dehydrogenase [Helicobacter sp.]MCI7484505.1 homoserine dehydrogenase [Helicobacter sp.]MDD7567073.1 homoserine dehydrogenase [Helicobacter sp.]MDY5739954.1 homoserine dehydrogenase [Helicobacter sp.]RAX55547.1 homoserine dehydrogenase [Helicobacter sp. 10-6591]
MVRKIYIGIIGVGVVGSSVIRILKQNQDLIGARAGVEFVIKKAVVRDIPKAQKLGILEADKFHTDIDSILNDKDIDVVIELIGGVEFAYEIAKKALQNNKALITANKAMLAYHRYDLARIAKELPIGFEASVGGGIPIVRTLRDCLASNHIQAIYGILNGTSNYILTQMFDHNKDFYTALLEAQNLGYAESDPTLDINGLDAGHKLLILATLAYGINALPEDILIEGISDITPDDMEFAREFGYTIKLLGIAKSDNNELELRVHPSLILKDCMISKVGGVMNGVSVIGDCAGESMYYGAGAGGNATASSVIADLIEIARDTHSSMLGFSRSFDKNLTLKSIEKIRSRYYIRLYTQDKPGVLSQITQILGDNNISIQALLQKEHTEQGMAKLFISTHTSIESDINKALQEIQSLPIVSQKPYKIRIQDL